MVNTIGIVGGSGYVGFSLAKKLSNQYNVKILDVNTPAEKIPSNCTFKSCNITSMQDIVDGLSDVDIVIHTAIIQIPKINESKKLGYDVNIRGLQNVCETIEQNSRIKGLILTSTWHTIGEREINGNIDEDYGMKPDKVEDRAKLYTLSKIAQESIVRYYDLMSNKLYCIIRLGTVLGKGMPEKTAANLFIEKGLKGEILTPYKESMYRPMLYVDINDVCLAFERYIELIIKNGKDKKRIINLYYPKPITILDLANYIQKDILFFSNERISPEIKIIDNGKPSPFNENSKEMFTANIDRLKELLHLDHLTDPKDTVKELVRIKYFESQST